MAWTTPQANDILMPDNWLLRMVEAALNIPNTGMCGIHCVEGINPLQTINGIQIHPQDASFGNVLPARTSLLTFPHPKPRWMTSFAFRTFIT